MLAGDQNGDPERGAELYSNFLMMAISFSANHGCVVACLAYASAQLGDHLGGYGSGMLYVFYAITAFFFAKPVVSMVGPKNGLLLGVGGYCFYVVGFLLAVILKDTTTRWVIFLSTNIIGGCAGGLLWTAQGRYFARNAKLYAENMEISVEAATASLAGVFATCYLGAEVITKVIATVVFISNEGSAPFIIFTTYTAIAFLAVSFVTRLDTLKDEGTWDFDTSSIVKNSLAAGTILIDEPRLTLLVPFQFAFGFVSSFMTFHVFGTVIGDSDHLGGTYIGLLSAIVALTGAVTAVPAGWVAKHYGKTILMTVGGLCFMLCGAAFLPGSVGNGLGTWALIVPYLVMFGVGRGTWENTNKAVIADYFSDSAELSTSAFACISFTSGISAAFGFFMWESISVSVIAWVLTITSLLAVLGYYITVHLHEQYRESKIVTSQSLGL